MLLEDGLIEIKAIRSTPWRFKKLLKKNNFNNIKMKPTIFRPPGLNAFSKLEEICEKLPIVRNFSAVLNFCAEK